MKQVFAICCTALALAALPSAGWAGDVGFARSLALPASEIVQQRKDADETSRPLPPSGPATPVPFCSPGAPICP